MPKVLLQVGLAVLAAVAAHAIAYYFMRELPDAAIVSLLFEAGSEEAISIFREQASQRSYLDSLKGMLSLDFGRTLDGVPTTVEIQSALLASGPRLVLSFCLIISFVVGVSLLPRSWFSSWIRMLGLLAFLPPFTYPIFAFLTGLSFGLQRGHSPGPALLFVLSSLAIAIGPMALAGSQALGIVRNGLESLYARVYLAAGRSRRRLRIWLLNNVWAGLTPSLEKIFTGVLVALLFAEPILGLSGIGTMTLRAIRRGDSELVLALVMLFSLFVGFGRVLSWLVRERYGIRS